jgi:NADH-quinone oxidoreductase subunit E
MVMIFKDTYEDLTPKRLEEIIDAFEAGKGSTVKPGPQVDRIFSAPEGGLTSLTGNAAAAKPARKAAAKTVEPASPARTAKTAKAPAAKTTKVPAAKPAKEAKPQLAPAQALVSLDDPNRPRGIKKPAKPDDLKMIAGVGPKIEKILHELGIFTFAQVAAWKKAEREWVDGYLKFSGRIERDDWVKQAKALAKGGEAEYIRVFGKKPR